MTVMEPEQIDLDRYAFRMTIGEGPGGIPLRLKLEESHGVIAAGSDRSELLRLGSALARSVLRSSGAGSAQVIWAGRTAPSWIGAEPGTWSEGKSEGIAAALEAFRLEQARRFDVMRSVRSTNLPHYNALAESSGKPLLPFMLFVLEDLPAAGSLGLRFLDRLCGAARYGRACGMLPLVLATDPTPQALPARLKAEIQDRVALRLPDRRSSVMALMVLGAERLGPDEALYRNAAGKVPAVRVRIAWDNQFSEDRGTC